MYHFEEKIQKNFSPERPRENVWGLRDNVSPGPAVALDGPASQNHISSAIARTRPVSFTIIFAFVKMCKYDINKAFVLAIEKQIDWNQNTLKRTQKIKK